jgi:hypothetical protein
MIKTVLVSLLTVLSLSILGSAIWLGTYAYRVTDAIQAVTVFYSKDEMLVFIGHSKAILAGRRIDIIRKQITSGLLVPEHVSDDLLVAHLKDGVISKNDLRGFGFFGTPLAHRGHAYWYVGVSNIWEVNDSNLVALSPTETSTLDGRFNTIGESNRTEGWNKKNFQPGWKNPEVIIPLQGEEVKVYADVNPIRNGQNHRVRIMVAQIGKTNMPETVIDIVEGYQKISKAEYSKLITQKIEGAQTAM